MVKKVIGLASVLLLITLLSAACTPAEPSTSEKDLRELQSEVQALETSLKWTQQQLLTAEDAARNAQMQATQLQNQPAQSSSQCPCFSENLATQPCINSTPIASPYCPSCSSAYSCYQPCLPSPPCIVIYQAPYPYPHSYLKPSPPPYPPHPHSSPHPHPPHLSNNAPADATEIIPGTTDTATVAIDPPTAAPTTAESITPSVPETTTATGNLASESTPAPIAPVADEATLTVQSTPDLAPAPATGSTPVTASELLPAPSTPVVTTDVATPITQPIPDQTPAPITVSATEAALAITTPPPDSAADTQITIPAPELKRILTPEAIPITGNLD